MVSISAKTGSAGSLSTVAHAINTNAVSYGPSDNPKIVVAVVFPHTHLSSTVSQYYPDIINLIINSTL